MLLLVPSPLPPPLPLLPLLLLLEVEFGLELETGRTTVGEGRDIVFVIVAEGDSIEGDNDESEEGFFFVLLSLLCFSRPE